MDSNTSLALTAKGVEEVKHRTCKLSIRKRSVLLLLETPHRVVDGRIDLALSDLYHRMRDD